MGFRKDLTGKQFGKLTVLSFAGNTYRGKSLWRCKCICGNEHVTTGERLTISQCSSCPDCIKKREGDPRNKSRLHTIWKHMKERCNNVNNSRFSCYGGRGITYCPEWEDFLSFYNWAVTNGYRDDLTIDRIDVNGNYCPENCRWATVKEQNENKTTRKELTANGETHSFSEWGRILNVNYKILWARHKAGWPDDKVINTPCRTQGVYISTKRR